jgi:hypothetical protein
MTIQINGVAHVILTVSNFSAARVFYGKLLPTMGMTPVCDKEKFQMSGYKRGSPSVYQTVHPMRLFIAICMLCISAWLAIFAAAALLQPATPRM